MTINVSQLLKFFSAALIFVVIAEGCSSVQPSTTSTTEPEIVNLPSTITPTSTIVPSLTSTLTKSPAFTLTPYPTKTPLPSATSTSTKTPTLLPTLTKEESRASVLELLDTNGGCRLPCWWGIEPGRTSWVDAERFLLYLNFSSYGFRTADGSIKYQASRYPLDNQDIYNDHYYYEKAGVVQSINIIGDGFYDQSYFKKIWKNFSPENIVASYGIPTRVWLRSNAYFPEDPPGTMMQYMIWIFYDNLGFLATYTGVLPYTTTYHICPTFSYPGKIYRLDFYMQSPDATSPLEKLTRFPDKDQWGFLTIEEATMMSVEDFYTLFTQSGNTICFDTPREIWK